MEGALATARASLDAILNRYDHDNRVMIDQVYGQLSPTLDDFYDERLTISFPTGRRDATDAPVTPHLTLTRVLPAGGPTRRAENQGAPFPIAQVHSFVAHAATDPSSSDVVRNLAARLLSGEAWLAPRQVGRSQKVVVRVLPGGEDLVALLASSS
jgi:hypothetical protein